MIKVASVGGALLILMAGAMMLSGNYQLRAIDAALGQVLRKAIAEQRQGRLPSREPIAWSADARGGAA